MNVLPMERVERDENACRPRSNGAPGGRRRRGGQTSLNRTRCQARRRVRVTARPHWAASTQSLGLELLIGSCSRIFVKVFF